MQNTGTVGARVASILPGCPRSKSSSANVCTARSAKKTAIRTAVFFRNFASRSVYFTSALMEQNIELICLDMPNVDKTMIQMMSIMAGWELDQCSKRTKAVLAAAKARGVKLGTNGKKLGKLNKKAAVDYYQDIKSQVIVSLGKTRKRTLQHYTDTLNRSGVTTRCYGRRYPKTVKNMFKHLDVGY